MSETMSKKSAEKTVGARVINKAVNDSPRFANRSELVGILVLGVLLVVILPLTLDIFLSLIHI